jgi:Ca2+-binding EF-hand superfamily protein
MISMTSLGFEPKNQALYDAIAALDTIDFPTFLNLMTARLTKKDSR